MIKKTYRGDRWVLKFTNLHLITRIVIRDFFHVVATVSWSNAGLLVWREQSVVDRDSGKKQAAADYADQRFQATDKETVKVGDTVPLERYSRISKRDSTYLPEPHQITKRDGDQVVIQVPDGISIRQNMRATKPFSPSTSSTATLTASSTETSESQQEASSTAQTSGEPPVSPMGCRPQRVRNSPAWLSDYAQP